jgi:large subunit ribosomal protein L9
MKRKNRAPHRQVEDDLHARDRRDGKAFGSVTANDIATRLKNEVGADIERHRIVLEHPIKSTGEHEISIKLHPMSRRR